jgi:hypothetical protein
MPSASCLISSPSAQDGTDELLAVIARECSAKEVVMAAQEMVEHLRTDAGEVEDVDSSSEPDVNLAVQFTRIMSLFAKGKHICPQSCQCGVDLGLLDCSHSSARAPQITITDSLLTWLNSNSSYQRRRCPQPPRRAGRLSAVLPYLFRSWEYGPRKSRG